tara:strand:- start:254 stop:367 length:114 start_codon:yes stop_codon:yes gene_type:complete
MSEWSFEDLSERIDPDPDPDLWDDTIQTTLIKRNTGN